MNDNGGSAYPVPNDANMNEQEGMTSLDCSLTVVQELGAMTAVRRPDGLKVFISTKDPEWLNELRIGAETKREVILAVALYRGMQIAQTYARQHAPELRKEMEAMCLLGNQVPLLTAEVTRRREADNG